MNRETVGNENLPNVFIEKIDIYPYAGDGTVKRIIVKLVMYDHSDTTPYQPLPDRSWFGVINDLQVKLAFMADEEINQIDNPLISLYDYDVSLDGIFVDNVNTFEIAEELDKFTKFAMEFEYVTPVFQNMNVYAACFIDLQSPFGNDLFDRFYGPMSGERIYVGGLLNKESGYFFLPETNEEYAGPVHLHPGRDQLMEGSEHSEDPHRAVRYVEEANYKITEVLPLGSAASTPGEDQETETTIEGEVIG